MSIKSWILKLLGKKEPTQEELEETRRLLTESILIMVDESKVNIKDGFYLVEHPEPSDKDKH